ncbi:PQQ-binding-like beta-propeller repeat protein [Pontiellaceae bacterium B12227]|nr:PQQ-binding-like beta-propeller repeat protein [Pontiellaceae bacterium B12227]
MIWSKLIPALLCCSSLCRAEWPTYHGNASLCGVSKTELPDKLHLRWRFNAGGAVDATPVSDGNRIYFTAKGGTVFALDVKGAKLWEAGFKHTNDAGQERPERIEASLVCAEGFVVVGTVRGVVHGLDAATGETKWSYDSGGIIVGSPNVAGTELILLDQSEGSLHALDLHTGKLRWKTEPIERCDGVPGIGKQHLVFGSCLAAFHVFSREGKPLRDVEVGDDGQVAGGVAVSGTQAFGGTRDGAMLCVDLDSGELIWSSEESEEQTFTTPAVTDDRVIYGSDDGFIYAVNRDDGSLLWSFNTEGIPYSAAVAGDKVVAVADGYLFLLNLNDGKELWSREVSDDITSPALIDAMVVVGADDGTVSAWGPPLTARDSNVDE